MIKVKSVKAESRLQQLKNAKRSSKSVTIIKRRGHREPYDERKVYGSVYAACLAAQEKETTAEKIAATVAARLTRWVWGKKSLTSDAIFRQVIIELAKHSYKAAFLYENHRDLS